MNIGLISDTHGLLRPEAVRALQGADFIIHAGDIGGPEILEELRRIAPVRAIRGNVDREAWAKQLPETDVIEIADRMIYVIHNVHDLDLNPRAAGFACVVSGHSHQSASEVRDGVLYFNPGSAGPRRFKLPISIGRLLVEGKSIRGEIVILG